MSRDFKVASSAKGDFRRIFRWLCSRSRRGAIAWREAFWHAVFRIADDAESFALAEESPRLKRQLRDALFKTRRGRVYRIVFEFNETDVFILRVRRPGQRPLKRRDLPRS